MSWCIFVSQNVIKLWLICIHSSAHDWTRSLQDCPQFIEWWKAAGPARKNVVREWWSSPCCLPASPRLWDSGAGSETSWIRCRCSWAGCAVALGYWIVGLHMVVPWRPITCWSSSSLGKKKKKEKIMFLSFVGIFLIMWYNFMCFFVMGLILK